jgi:hypothetical protein
VFGVGCETRPAVLSQQVGEAGGSLTLEVQGRAGSSLDNAGTVRNRQTVRVRQARREGVTRVNQWLNPLKCGTGSNLTDVGRAAVRADLEQRGQRLLRRSFDVLGEVTVKVCGVAVARLQGQSWAPPSTTGTW